MSKRNASNTRTILREVKDICTLRHKLDLGCHSCVFEGNECEEVKLLYAYKLEPKDIQIKED